MLFLASGSISLKYGTTDIHEVRGILKTAPWTGFAFLCGLLALIGLPPFGPFISEFIIFRAGFAAHSVAYAAAGIALLVLVFAGMLGSVNQMLYGRAREQMASGDLVRWPSEHVIMMMPLALNALLLVGLGLFLPAGVREFFGQVLKVMRISL